MITATSKFDLADQVIESGSSSARRALDLLIAIPATIVLLPVFAVIAVWIKLNSRGPVFFLQERIGRGGLPFRIFKFRTPNSAAHRLPSGATLVSHAAAIFCASTGSTSFPNC
jgi:lipopolysaccharide/colanic/teichoic acid biosynthesis glycosyltransferase